MNVRQTIIAIVTVLIWHTAISSPPAQGNANDEYLVKALFLTRFCTFISWPSEQVPGAQSVPFTIGILGEDPFDGVLEEVVSDNGIQGQPARIIHVKNIDEAARCRVVFIRHPSESFVS
ncbi:DUF4154 domain-containing protein [bacterium]|nr:DUF4154 domain-containing protein [bacterium]